MDKHTSEIKINVTLDENKIPEIQMEIIII